MHDQPHEDAATASSYASEQESHHYPVPVQGAAYGPPSAPVQPSTGVSAELFRAQSEYEDHRKSSGIAYLLWFFLGAFGGHRFYLRQTGTAVAMLLLGITVVGLLVTGIWALVDAFLIPGIARKVNDDMRREIYGRYRVPLY